MSDIKLFRIVDNSVMQVEGLSLAVERSPQTLNEKHLEVFLGIRLLASEYTPGKHTRGELTRSVWMKTTVLLLSKTQGP